MSFQFETINISKSFIYIIEKLSRTSWSVWLNDATRIRTVFSSRFSVLVECHLFWSRYCTYYLWFAFRIDHHLLDPIWWRHFTTWKYVCRDLSFLLLNLIICLGRRCYRDFCSSSEILFWFYVDSAGGLFDNWYVDRADEQIYETMKDSLCSARRRRCFECALISSDDKKNKFWNDDLQALDSCMNHDVVYLSRKYFIVCGANWCILSDCVQFQWCRKCYRNDCRA